MKQSYGFVEVKGLALAITVADAMAKSANIELINTERAKGGGWIQVQVAGDVGAVEAAVDVGISLATQHNGLVASKVIARPDAMLVELLNPAPVNAPDAVKKAPEPEQKPAPAKAAPEPKPATPTEPVRAAEKPAQPESTPSPSKVSKPTRPTAKPTTKKAARRSSK